MINEILLYIGSIIILIWGIGHIIPTKSVVNGFGKISEDSKRILTMEWIAEGLTLIFLGILVLVVTISGGANNDVSIIVFRVTAIMLFAMAGLTSFTGARTSIIPIKICPIVKSVVAILFILGSIL